MNNTRRKIIQKAISDIESVLQDVLDEEQERRITFSVTLSTV